LTLEITITKTERRILTALMKAEYTIGELSIILGISKTTIRDHIQKLKQKNLIFDRILLHDNRKKLYSANAEAEKILSSIIQK